MVLTIVLTWYVRHLSLRQWRLAWLTRLKKGADPFWSKVRGPYDTRQRASQLKRILINIRPWAIEITKFVRLVANNKRVSGIVVFHSSTRFTPNSSNSFEGKFPRRCTARKLRAKFPSLKRSRVAFSCEIKRRWKDPWRIEISKSRFLGNDILFRIQLFLKLNLNDYFEIIFIRF